MRLTLNLATQPLVTHRRFLVGSGAVGAIAVLVFVSVGWHVYGVRRAQKEIRNKTLTVEKQMEVYAGQRRELDGFFKRPENAKLHERAAYLNTLIDARSFDWTQMFMDMERLLPGGVRVVSIAQKLDNGRVVVKLSVGASSDVAKLKFLRALEGSREFSDVRLLSEHVPSGSSAGSQSVLELTAFYSRI
jgi:Tfp pilus assembly protein PilN